jgi:hypothetical protein
MTLHNICMYIRTHARARACMHAHTSEGMHAHTSAHTHACTHLSKFDIANMVYILLANF